MNSIVLFDNLQLTYTVTSVLKNISLQIEQGE